MTEYSVERCCDLGAIATLTVETQKSIEPPDYAPPCSSYGWTMTYPPSPVKFI